MKWRTTWLICWLSVVIGMGCKGSGRPSQDQKDGTKYLSCADITSPDPVRRISLSPLTLVMDGDDMKVEGIQSSLVTVGALSGIQDNSGPTQENIAFFIDAFKAARVQAVLIAGGVGKTRQEILEILSLFKSVPVPIMVLPGAQESFSGFREAMETLAAQYPQFVDMTMIRRAVFKHVQFLGLPGYYNPFYLEAGHLGCSYDETDVKNLKKRIAGKLTTVLLSASPPLGKGAMYPDVGRGGINIGDPALATFMMDAPVRFGLFGHVYESGGNIVSPLTEKVPAINVWHSDFWLQLGAASAIPISLVGGGRAAGMAHIVEFSGNRGRFRQLVPGQ